MPCCCAPLLALSLLRRRAALRPMPRGGRADAGRLDGRDSRCRTVFGASNAVTLCSFLPAPVCLCAHARFACSPTTCLFLVWGSMGACLLRWARLRGRLRTPASVPTLPAFSTTLSTALQPFMPYLPAPCRHTLCLFLSVRNVRMPSCSDGP